MVPLIRFVDAVRPESESVRHLEQEVRRLLAGSEESVDLRATFRAWAENDARLQPSGELVEISKNLSQLGSIGLHALDYFRHIEPLPSGWAAEQLTAIDRMQKPQAEVMLAATRPVRLLVQALANK